MQMESGYLEDSKCRCLVTMFMGCGVMRMTTVVVVSRQRCISTPAPDWLNGGGAFKGRCPVRVSFSLVKRGHPIRRLIHVLGRDKTFHIKERKVYRSISPIR